MDVLTIYSASGDVLLEITPEVSSSQDWAVMSENRVQIEFYTDECTLLPSGCYCDFDGRRFWLLDEYKPTEESSAEWHYTVRFVGAESLLAVTMVLKVTDGEDLPIFPLTAPASQHLELIVANLRRRFPSMGWSVGTVIDTENITIEYSGTYCSEALQQIVADRDTEWWVDDNYAVHIGRCEIGELIDLGYQNGLIGGITHSLANNLRSYAYLYPIGSTRNINPETYGYDRLQLPDGIKVIPMNPEQGVAELAEASAFEQIFPRYVGTVTAVRTTVGTNDDGSEFTIYHIEDSTIPFNPNEYELAGEVKHLTFQSGELMGADFEVNYDEIAHEFEIITQWPTSAGTQLPGGLLVPAVGDEYVIWNISMPDEYYPLAEQEFLEAAQTFAADSVKDASVYRAPVDYIDIQDRGLRLRPGQRVRLRSDEYFPEKGYYDSRITRIQRDICYPDEMTIEISTVLAQGTISRLQTAIKNTETKVEKVEQATNAMPGILTTTSAGQATDANVYSALRADREFLSKEKGGTVKKKVNFVESIQLFGRDFFRYDAEKDAWELNGNLVVTGGAAFFTKLEGFDGLDITSSLNVDGTTISNEGGILKVIGGTGGGIDEDQLAEYLSENGYATQSWVTDKGYALQSSLTTVDNRLKAVETFFATDDTDSYVNKWDEIVTFLNAVEGDTLDDILSTKADKTIQIIAGTGLTGGGTLAANRTLSLATTGTAGTYTKVTTDAYGRVTSGTTLSASDIPNLSWSKITSDKPTTLSGYGITDAYTKTEIGNAFVSRTTAQDITAQHNFVNGIKLFGKSPFRYDSGNDAWELDGNLVVTGGAAFFTKLEGFDGLDITSSLNVDGTTISNEGGILKFVGEAGGIDTDAVNELIDAALVGYATQTWVTNQKYFTQANFTKANIKSTLGISDWALAASKPSYAWSEITSKPYKIFYSLNAVGNPNDYQTSNISAYAYSSGGGATDGIFASFYSNNFTAQMQFKYNTATPYVRVYDNTASAWSGWKQLAFNSKFADYLALAGGTMTGTLISQAVTPAAHLTYNIGSSSRAFVRTYTQYLDSPTSYNLRLCSAGTEVMTITTAGNVRIGAPTSTSRATFDVTGDAFISGQLAHALTSDRRLKRNIRKFSAAKYLRSLGGVFEFEYIDEEVARDKYYEGTHLGFIYQNVKGSRLTGMCIERENGFGALNLLHSDYLALLGAAATEHEDRIHTLERQIKALQKELKQLKSA